MIDLGDDCKAAATEVLNRAREQAAAMLIAIASIQATIASQQGCRPRHIGIGRPDRPQGKRSMPVVDRAGYVADDQITNALSNASRASR
jgi:hypothetical protein